MAQFTEDDFDSSFKELMLIVSISEKVQGIYQLCANNYKNSPNKCFQASEQIIKISLQAGYYEGQAYGNNLLGMIFILKSNFEQAIVSLSLALKIADNVNVEELKGKILNNLGSVYEKLGDFDKAMIFYSDAYQSAERCNNIRLKSALQSNMAVIYVHMKDYNNALTELKKIVDNKESNFPSDILLNVYFNICSCYRSKHELNEALNWSLKSQQLAIELKNEYMEMRSVVLYVEILIDLKELKRALEIMESNMGKIINLNNNTLTIHAYMIYGKVKAEETDFSSSNNFYLKAFEIVKQHGYKKMETELLLNLSDLNSKHGNYEQAYKYLNAFRNLNDELMDNERINKIQQLQVSNQLAQITREKELAEQATLSKSNFLSNMSHEIRTPMNAIIGFAELLSSTKNMSEEELNYVNTIKQSSDNLLHIINEILDFSKIEAGKIEFKNEVFHLESELKKVHQLFGLQASKKNLQLNLVVDKSLPANFIGDSYRLNQILVNIIGNALKFTEKGMVNIAVSGTTISDNKINLSFKISDTGIGINQQKMDQLFERFKQVSIETTYRFGGTGLGLAISKQLVELQGGSLGVESKEHKGTTFTFILPYVIMNDLYLKEPHKYIEPNVIFNEHFRVLVADDNPFNQLLIKKVFAKHFHNGVVESVENGNQVLSMLKRFKYDFILMDMRMPEMDGITAAKKIRSMKYESFSKVPIVAFTAGVTDEEKQKAKEAGMHLFLPKPFTKEDLINIVTELGIISF